jgi:hypothetical protein
MCNLYTIRKSAAGVARMKAIAAWLDALVAAGQLLPQ